MSKFVGEKVIEDIIEYLDDDNNFDALEQRWENDYPAIGDYLQQDSFSLLKPEERAYVHVMVGILFLSWEKVNGTVSEDLDPRVIEKLEEANWEKFHKSKARGFRDKLTPFFEGSPQEDLLAFIEDSIEDDEDQMVTGAARDIIFICAVTVLDTLMEVPTTTES